MAAVLPQPDETARKIQATIFQKLSTVGQANIAKDLGVSEPTVSRMKEKEIPELAKLLALLGLKVVPLEYKCVAREYLAGLETFAGLWLEHTKAEREAGRDSGGLTWD